MNISDRSDITQVLAQMRDLRSQVQPPQTDISSDVVRNVGQIQPNQQVGETQSSFSALLDNAVNTVNDIQRASGAAQTAFQMGDPNVDITEVMIKSQKSAVATQAMIQVRNRLVSAYEEIMRMPV